MQNPVTTIHNRSIDWERNDFNKPQVVPLKGTWAIDVRYEFGLYVVDSITRGAENNKVLFIGLPVA